MVFRITAPPGQTPIKPMPREAQAGRQWTAHLEIGSKLLHTAQIHPVTAVPQEALIEDVTAVTAPRDPVHTRGLVLSHLHVAKRTNVGIALR